MVSLTYNGSYLGGCHLEDCGSRPAWAKEFLRSHNNGEKAGCSGTHLSPSDSKKLKIGVLQSRLSWKKARPYLQNNKRKKG
jgi:hypothetical protein